MGLTLVFPSRGDRHGYDQGKQLLEGIQEAVQKGDNISHGVNFPSGLTRFDI